MWPFKWTQRCQSILTCFVPSFSGSLCGGFHQCTQLATITSASSSWLHLLPDLHKMLITRSSWSDLFFSYDQLVFSSLHSRLDVLMPFAWCVTQTVISFLLHCPLSITDTMLSKDSLKLYCFIGRSSTFRLFYLDLHLIYVFTRLLSDGHFYASVSLWTMNYLTLQSTDHV